MKTQDAHLPAALQGLRIPLIASPLFIISVPKLVIAQCKAGIVGSFPALNAREGEGEHPLLDTWLTQIKEELDRHNQANPDQPAAPYAVNQIVHTSAIELARSHPSSICVALHPGTVVTPFTEKYLARHPDVPPDEAAQNMLGVIDGLTPKPTGQFYDWAGKAVPW